MTTPISITRFTASTSFPLFVLRLSIARRTQRSQAIVTHRNSSCRYTSSTSPALRSIFSSPMSLSARLGPAEIINTGFRFSVACFTSRNAEYVASEVPRTSSRDAEEINSRLGSADVAPRSSRFIPDFGSKGFTLWSARRGDDDSRKRQHSVSPAGQHWHWGDTSGLTMPFSPFSAQIRQGGTWKLVKSAPGRST